MHPTSMIISEKQEKETLDLWAIKSNTSNVSLGWGQLIAQGKIYFKSHIPTSKQ